MAAVNSWMLDVPAIDTFADARVSGADASCAVARAGDVATSPSTIAQVRTEIDICLVMT